IVTGSADKTARVWHVKSAEPTSPPMPHQDTVLSVAMSPAGSLVLTGSADRTARLWDAITGKPIGPALPHEGSVSSVAFHRKGETFVTGSEDQSTRLWEVPDPWPGDPQSVRAFVEAKTAMKLDKHGAALQLVP